MTLSLDAIIVTMNFIFTSSLQVALNIFARGGGGGSGGGGASAVLILAGYAVMSQIAKPIRKRLPRKAALAVTATIASVLSILVLILTIVIAVAGSRSGLIWAAGAELIFGIWFGWTSRMFNLWDKMSAKFKKADQDLAKAGWNEEELKQITKDTFLRYQRDWSERKDSSFQEYMTTSYTHHATLMVQALKELQRFNTVNNPEIIKMDTVEVVDDTDDSKDQFSMLIEAKANDILLDETGKQLYVDNNSFIERWDFVRGNNSWLLAGIRQSTESVKDLEISLKQFAENSSMFYSLDMGWLFIPSRGQLFRNGQNSFGKSDINNHVIGLYNNHLVQMYTYKRAENNASTSGFLVGQISLPKSYGGIIIEAKKSFIERKLAHYPDDYKQYQLEWPDFNDRYDVYATDQSRLATFELLNPGFMAFFYDNFKDVAIEVVDNIVYFYSIKIGSRDDYDRLLQLLVRAFKELKL